MDLTAEQYEILFGEPPSEPSHASATVAPERPQAESAHTDGPNPATFDAPPQVYLSPQRPTVSLVRVEEQIQKPNSLDRSSKPAAIAVLLFAVLVLSPLVLLQFRGDPDVEVLSEAVTAVDPGTTETPAERVPSNDATPGSVQDRLGAERDRARATLASAEVVPIDTDVDDFDLENYRADTWPDSDGDCQSDREEVLITESLDEPSLDVDGCRVIRGRWIDPFTGQEHTNPEALTVERLVPLEIAHVSGAAQWTQAQQRAYAVDAAFGPSLVVVSQDAVQDRNALGPDTWMPAESLRCRYAIDWISVKSRWGLTFTSPELVALEEMLTTCGLESTN